MKDKCPGAGNIALVMGDITVLNVDAIVNAANNTLLGGGGVDGAIHAVAGPELLEECRRLNGCPTGEARITKGYRLPARWVVHTVGPVWRGGGHGEDRILASCYKSCFDLAERYGLKSIAFPSVSTGAYGFPVDRASRIAITEMISFLKRCESIEILAVCYNQKVYECYVKALDEI